MKRKLFYFEKKPDICTPEFHLIFNYSITIMPTKIRLQRKGKKGQPFYHLVVADGRAPRDGKFIERLGTYNPMTHPATIDLNFDRALYWVQVGAQPTDTARSILSNQGVMFKYHLIKGISKGAHTEEQVEEKFSTWMKEKAEKLANASKEKELSEKEQVKKRLEEERKINEAKAEELSKKRAKASLKPEEVAESPEEAPAGEAPAEETKEEATAEKAPAEETPAAEKAKEEAPAEKVPAEETKEEAPAEKVPAEETKEEAAAEKVPAEETKEEAPAEKTKEEAPAEEDKKEEDSGKKSE